MCAKRTGWILVLTLAVLMGGCRVQAPGTSAPTQTPGVTLTLFNPRTATPEPSSTPVPVFTPTPRPSATPTPFLYTIVEGDTMIAVAVRFGLTLADLLAANPGVDPQFLRIGDALVIPLSPDAPVASLPTPVSAVVSAALPACLPASDGSWWCFWQVRNEGSVPVEGLAAEIVLVGPGGLPLAQGTGLPAIERLSPGETVPLFARFTDLDAGPEQVAAHLAAAFPVGEGEGRFLEVEADLDVELFGKYAQVGGNLQVSGADPVGQYRIALVAYGPDGSIVGLRVILLPGGAGPVPFSAQVFSLGPPIERVIVLAEAYATGPIP